MSFDLILPFLRPIEPLLRDDEVSEILGNPDTNWFTEREGKLCREPDISFATASLRTGLEVIANHLGKRLDEDNPRLHARLPDGSRIAVWIPPVVGPAPAVSIRKFTSRHFTVEDLIVRGMLTRSVAEFLAEQIQAGKTLLISGGTGSGKTTLLRISMIYREAIRNGWTERNPAQLIKSKTEPSGRIRYLLDEEEAKLRKVMDTDYVSFRQEFDIALHTGMRKHEQFACRWDWVEVKSKRIMFPGEIAKNGKSRVVRLNADAIAALEQQRTITGSESHIFMSPTGKPYPDKVIRGWFDDACCKAGIKNFTWHCLRHTFCSRLVMAGVDLKTVQELAGHLTISVTARYSHLSQQYLETAIEKISTVHRGEPTATSKKIVTKR